MPTLRLDIEYDGAGFAGWAEQPGQRTIEGVLRDALEVVLGRRPEVRVAGRTDAGVHATAQVVSLEVPAGTDPPQRAAADPDRLRRSLNGLLPDDVAVRATAQAPEGFDARADALSRAYDYRILIGPPSPLRRDRTLRHTGPPLDRAALDACAAATVGQHDFTAFTPTVTQHVFFDRTVLACAWRDGGEAGDELILRIEADAFLRHMLRVLVGTMLEVGRGVRDVASYVALLEGGPRSAAGPTAPPHPLT
ncbi:MAG: tRNA pseudouridine(38-40) synthase TruA, partial [Actinobacteria bacterium]|nr:tRNA pseudouridine(38-40) synthase TruA [Actinomycetota bacterium]